jgi:hypothetical protein
VTNNQTTPATFQYWIMVTLPSGANFGPVLGPVNLTLNPSATLARTRTQAVPGGAPAGNYVYHAYVGTYPNTIITQAQFDFTKSAGDGGYHLASGNWNCGGEAFSEEGNNSIETYKLCTVHPNPFNPETVISFELLEASEVDLRIYDIAGREVASIVKGQWSTGVHQVVWNAEGLPGGIYFARLSIDGDQSLVQKLLLLK